MTAIKASYRLRRSLLLRVEDDPQKLIHTRLLKLRKEQDRSKDKKVKHRIADQIRKLVKRPIEKKDIRVNSAITYASPAKGIFRFHRYPLQIRKKMRYLKRKNLSAVTN